MMENPRREAILHTLREDYGITTTEQLMDAIRNMKKLDITQALCCLTKTEDLGCLRSRLPKSSVAAARYICRAV